MKQNSSFCQRVSAVAASCSISCHIKKSLRLLVLLCMIVVGGNAWGESVEINFSGQSTTHAYFPIKEKLDQYAYSSDIVGWDLLKLLKADKGGSVVITNKQGVKITGITVSGVADNNSNQSTVITVSDGTNSITTGSASWNNRKSSNLTTKSFSSANVGKLLTNVGTEYTFTTTYNVGIKITITYEPVVTKSYTIIYNTNEGSTIESESGVTALPNPLPVPTKEGYTFEGWYTDEGLNTPAVGGATIDGDITLYAKWSEIPSAVYTFSYGEKGNAYETKEFVQVGGTNEWQIENFVFPDVSTNQACYVGVNGNWYNDNLGSANAKSADLYFWDMPLALLQGDDACSECNKLNWDRNSSNGHKAIGTLRIFDNYGDDNLYVGFIPDGYGLMYGKDGGAWSSLAFVEEAGDVWTTDLTELTADMVSGAYSYYVGLLTSDNAYTYCGNSETSTMKDMGVYYSSWHNNLNQFGAGQHGKFRIWANSCNGVGAKNFVCHFVPYYGLCYNANYPAGVSAPADEWSDFVSAEESRTLSLAAAPAAPAGYTFRGWTVNQDGTGDLLNPGGEYGLNNPEANTTLYAQWEEEVIETTCDLYLWFTNIKDAPAGVANTDKFTGVKSGTNDGAGTKSIIIDGVTYTVTSRQSNAGHTIGFTVTEGMNATLYMLANSSGSASRTVVITRKDGTIVSNGVTFAGSSSFSEIVISDIAAGEYTLTATGGNWGYGFLGLKECPALSLPDAATPTIEAQPKDVTYCEGDDIAALSVVASVSDGGTLSYQWQKDGADIADATSDSYKPTEAGVYRCVITNTKDGCSPASVTSAEAKVTFNVLPQITTQPAGVTGNAGAEATLSAEATGATAWQWYTCSADGTAAEPVAGATEATLPLVLQAGTTYYKVVVTNDCGEVASNVISVTGTEAETPCFSMTITATSGTIAGQTMLTSEYANIVGGSVLYDREESESMTFKANGAEFSSSKDYLKVTLDGTLLSKGTQVKITYTTNGTNRGIKLLASDKATEILSIINPERGTNITTEETVTADIKESIFYITRATDNTTHIKSIELVGCATACLEPQPALSPDKKDVLCGGGDVVFTASGFTPGAMLYLYREGATEALQSIKASAETVEFDAISVTATDKYYVVAVGECEQRSESVLVSVQPLPTEVKIEGAVSPLNIGEQCTLIAMTDGEDVSYQWYCNGAKIPGETHQTYIFKPADPGLANQTFEFYCVVTGCDVAKSVQSNTVSVELKFNKCYYIAGTTTLSATTPYDFGDIQMYHGGNKDNNYNVSTSNLCPPATARYYMTGVTLYLKTMGVSSILLQGQQKYDVEIASVAVSDALDGEYTEVTGYDVTNYTAEACGELGISGINFEQGDYVRLTFGGGDVNEFRVSGLCVEGPSCTMPDLSWSKPEVTADWDEVADIEWPTLTNPAELPIRYASSDESVATIDDAGKVTVVNTGATIISAIYESVSESDYCGKTATYVLHINCGDDVPMITSDVSPVECNKTIDLTLVQSDGTTPVSEGEVQWYCDDAPIAGATGYTLTVGKAGTYKASLTRNCRVWTSNEAVITNASQEPAVQSLVKQRTWQKNRSLRPYTSETKNPLFRVQPKNTPAYEGPRWSVSAEIHPQEGAARPAVGDINWVREDDASAEYITLGADYVLLGEWITANGLNVGDTIMLSAYPANACDEIDAYIHATLPIVITDKYSLAYIVTGTVDGDFLAVTKSELTDPLFADLQEMYDVTAVNAYAPFDKTNYDPYDLVLLTDYPKASGSGSYPKIVNNLAELVDYKPILSLKAHMAVEGLTKWHAVGFTGVPQVPGGNKNTEAQAQKTLTVLCYAHAIFDDNTQWDNQDDRTITVLSDVYKDGDTYKGLQGFTSVATSDFINIATISDGGTGTLIACCERQAVVDARLIVLSVNKGAHKYINSNGTAAIHNMLTYLLETDPVKVSDCAITFDNGDADGDGLPDEGRQGGGNHQWDNPMNWNTKSVPTPMHNVRIEADCEVSGETFGVANVRINNNYTLTINPDGGLISSGKFAQYANGQYYSAQPISDPSILHLKATDLKATDKGTAMLIHTHTQQLAATVELHSKAYQENDGKTKYWTYIGIPVQEAYVPTVFYMAYTYWWKEDEGWLRWNDGKTMTEFCGYALSQPKPETFTIKGDLALATDRSIQLTYSAGGMQGMNLVGNSWTAPIQITQMKTEDFGAAEAVVYVYNTGRDPEVGKPVSGGEGDAPAGQWITIPVETAKMSAYTGLKVIPAMQAFQVNTSTNTTLNLAYNRLVRDAAADYNHPLHAPSRKVAQAEGEPQLMHIRVADSQTYSDLWLLEADGFTDGFDNGWDGWFMGADGRSAGLWAFTPVGDMAVSAQPQLDGTTLGFTAGKETLHTFSFVWEGEDLWLNDTQLRFSTPILTGGTYSFIASDSDAPNRFVISSQPYSAGGATGLAEVVLTGDGLTLSNPTGEALQLAVYDAAGHLCSLSHTAAPMAQITLPQTQGVYMICVTGETTNIVRKVVR